MEILFAEYFISLSFSLRLLFSSFIDLVDDIALENCQVQAKNIALVLGVVVNHDDPKEYVLS